MMAANVRVNNEFYVLPVYQYLIDERGRTFRKLEINQVHVLGTPEELRQFRRWRAGVASVHAPPSVR